MNLLFQTAINIIDYNSFWEMFDKTVSVYFIWKIYIKCWKWPAHARNQHCASSIGTLSFPLHRPKATKLMIENDIMHAPNTVLEHPRRQTPAFLNSLITSTRQVLFRSLAVLDPRIGKIMDVLSCLCPVSFWLTLPRGVLSTSRQEGRSIAIGAEYICPLTYLKNMFRLLCIR